MCEHMYTNWHSNVDVGVRIGMDVRYMDSV